MSSQDTKIVVVGGLALAGLGLALKHFVLDKPAAPSAPASPSAPPAIPPAPGAPATPPLPSLPGASPLAMAAGVGDHVLVSATVLGPQPPGVPSALEMVVTQASPGSPAVMAKFVDAPYSDLPPITVPRQAIIGTVRTTVDPAPGAPGGPPPPPSDMPLLLDDPLVLRTGRKYRARVQLGALEGMFATRDAVEGQFTALGFSNVAAYDPQATPADWPPATKRGDLARTWFVEGTWNQPQKEVEKPSQIVMAWEA